MPCKIQIEDNIIFDVTEKTDSGFNKSLEGAKELANSVNKEYGVNVVKFYQEISDTIEREINIPTSLINEYYKSELTLEKEEEARNIQLKDAKRSGEDYSDKYMFQAEGVPASKASKETIENLKKAATQMGIKFQSLEDYAKGNPDIDVKGTSGLADLVKGVVAVALGKENVATTEEIVHISTAIIEQDNPELITEMISKIDRFKIYKKVLDTYSKRKDYQLANGKPNIRKIKKEAVDKLISEVIINQSEGSTEFPELMQEETVSLVKKWWNTILDVIRGMYQKSNIDIFKETGTKISEGKVEGTVVDIKGEEIFFQIEKNEEVDNFYDVIANNDARLDLINTDENDRHYLLDKTTRVAKSITQKVKEKQKMPEISSSQKIQDEQKRDWGSKGHVYLEQYITTNLIDKDGYKLQKFNSSFIESELNNELKQKLENFAKELISSYAPGTRFIVEKKVVNEKVKGFLASTVDFVAIEPNEKTGIKVDTLDWKFSSIDKSKTDDIPWYKRSEWKSQMGEYTNIWRSYGLRDNQIRKARMVPFITNYEYVIPGNPKSGLVLSSVEIGKVDSLTETNLYLLPVPLVTESTGNSKVDELVKSLTAQYENLYKKSVSPENKAIKNIQLNELSKAIRLLQVNLNFAPLYNTGKTLLGNAKTTIDSFDKIDFQNISKEELEAKLNDLLTYKNSAAKFESLDKIFLSVYPKEGLDSESLKTLKLLEELSSSTERMIDKINQIQTNYVIELAKREKISIQVDETEEGTLEIRAEKELDNLSKNFLEGSKLSNTVINLAAKLIKKAASLVKLNTIDQIEEYGKLLIPLEKEARAKGKTAFNMIGKMTTTGLELIKKIDPAFWNNIQEQKKAKNKQFFLDNINLEEYNKQSGELIKKIEAEINATSFSSDSEINNKTKEYRIKQLKDSLDINSPSFNGYDDFNFGNLVNKTLIEEGHYSKEYDEMRKSEAAYKMWQYFTALNQRAKEMGYLEGKSLSFFPLIEATALQKFYQSNNLSGQIKDFFQDLYTTRIDEEQNYSKIDPETQQVRKQIPKYFTRTNKSVEQLSTDLNKVGALYIKSLLEYENSKNMESTLHTLHQVEKNRGSLIVDNGEIVYEGGKAKVNKDVNKSADLLEVIINDELYKIGENLDSIGNIGLNSILGKFNTDEEVKERKVLSIKKGLNNSNVLVRVLGIGLKPLLALANWSGFQFQAYINAGGVYKFLEFEKNNLKTVSNNLSTVEKAFIHTFIPINEDVSVEKMRQIAKGISWKNYISTWNFSDVMMSTNSFPEKLLQIASGLSIFENSTVIDGKIINIRRMLKEQDRQVKYKMSIDERKALEKTFESRVKEIKEKSGLDKLAQITENGLVIPGVSKEEIANFRLEIIEHNRMLNGQMDENDKPGFRRDTIFRSFMMFRTWIPKQVSVRTLDIHKDIITGEWDYGKTRVFFKTWANLGFKNVTMMRDIISGNEKGLKLLDDMLKLKKQEYYKKTGQNLEITNEEFYDLMRTALTNQFKELGLLFGIMGLIIAAKAAEPPEDASDLEKNRYKYWAKAINKISDEISFYYNPASIESITKGNIVPSIGLLVKVEQALSHLSKETTGYIIDDPDMIKKAYPVKYFLNLIPVGSQIQNEVIPYLDPELAKELGIKVTTESRGR